MPVIFVAAYAAHKRNIVGAGLCYRGGRGGQRFAAFAGGVLVNWWAGGRNVFAEPAGIGKFVLIAVIAAAIGAGVGAASISVSESRHRSSRWTGQISPRSGRRGG